MKRKICIITGTRAEYGLLKPVILSVKKSQCLELLLMVTGMHFSKEFGRTVDLIKKDGIKITYSVKMHPKEDRTGSMATAIGQGIIEITKAFRKKRPDVVLVLGDRIEALAGAIAGAYLNIVVAHIHGGDISMAGLDESARHAITKISHIHFTASKKSMERVIKMGEKNRNVFFVGAPGLDTILNEQLLTKKELIKNIKLGLDGPFIMLVQHSVTTQVSAAGKQIRETIKAIKQLKIPTVVIYPNSDSGGRAIIGELNKIKELPYVKIFKNLEHTTYLSLLKYASVLIGNSSSGIIEAASFCTPVVNIGIRQNGRERARNVIDVRHNKDAILTAIEKCLYDKRFKANTRRCENSYGSGRASERIVKVLNSINIDNNLLQKQIAY